MHKTRVLVADEDAAQARALGTALVQHGYACELARTGTAALSAVVRGACDIVICDVRLGTSSDLELLDRMHGADLTMPIIILTARGSTSGAVEAMKHGAFHYLVRPCSMDDLYAHLRAAVAGTESARLPVSARASSSGDELLVHESPSMEALLETCALVARSSAPVLILGESGTGKELVARLIHRRSPRASRPFVAINTSAIPEHLLESELFGHVRGAYTGANHARAGLFAEADGGTILLDEIGDMPRTLQPKLLRVLQLGEVRAVGSDHTRRVDVRIIAATHRDLPEMIRAGQFRDDLHYRLNTLTLRLPALRDRREDIVPLARLLLRAALDRNPDSPVKSLGDEALAMLRQASWPGNVRELESAIERAVVLGRSAVVSVRDLAFLDCALPSPTTPAWPQTEGKQVTLREMTQRYVDWTLAQTHGDKTEAARRLGIDISTLYRRQRGRN
jgi:two-component system, NtrC family, response regulator HydG